MRIFTNYAPIVSPKRLKRYRQVVEVLARHGFGVVFTQLNLGQFVPFRRTLLRRRPEHSQAEHLRLALQELGATFIKLGQILSTRADLLPPDYIAELSRLQDHVPADPIDTVERQIIRELGAPPSELFSWFDPVPLASASLGQVHAARLRSGEAVVVKVQHPGVEDLVNEDMDILFDLARLAARRTTWGQTYDLVAVVEEFGDTLRDELDYVREGHNADRFRRNFADFPEVYVPEIYWQYTTKRVLTMERIGGIKISDLAALEAAGLDRKSIADSESRLVVKMVLEDGFFHADPHPGNFLVMDDETIGMLDYGMVGRLDESTRETLIFLFVGVLSQDVERIVDRLVDLGVLGNSTQLDHLRQDMSRLIGTYYGLPLREIDIGSVLEEMLTIIRRHSLQIPTNLTILSKMLAMHDGLARTLDPEFNFAEVMAPVAKKMAIEMYSPRRLIGKTGPALTDLARLMDTLPRRLERLTILAERGNLTVSARIQDFDYYLKQVHQMINRIVLTLISSALLITLALLLFFYKPPGFREIVPWGFGLAALIAALIGMRVIYTTWRSRRGR